MKMILKFALWLVLSNIMVCISAKILREPVMSHVAHPHNYYWREMYLPQLTTGPSSATFSPDGQTVIYSMQGTLWRQTIQADTAYQLTNSAGYDYQPDWSPDGKFIIFTRQQDNALNLMLLDLESLEEIALTQAQSSYLEPRWSPNGKKIAFISSIKGGFWGLYVADFNQLALNKVTPLIAGHQSERDRYYYSKTDHAINPSWSADGQRIFYVSNDEVAWGSGDIWSVNASDANDKKRILVEETTWSARPELSHDGKRLLYSSYQGRQWQQLWLTTIDGLSPLPLTFGDYDLQQARWSNDDKYLLYISNESGGLTLWQHTVVGGAKKQIIAKNKVYKSAMVSLTITLNDESGRALDGRVILQGEDGRHYAPDNSRMHGDDYLDPVQTTHETHYFHCFKTCTATVPAGQLSIKAMSGFTHKVSILEINTKGQSKSVMLTLPTIGLPKEFGEYVSADMHVHMNYGGKYKQTLARLAQQAKAEGLDVVYNLVVNKEQRIPDIAVFKTSSDIIDGVSIYQAQEYHSSYWGHMSFLHLEDHLLTPDFTSYRHTALRSPYPTNSVMIDLAKQQGAITGYVHPFDVTPDMKTPGRMSNSLPVDVVLGKTNFLEIVSFANHKETAKVWYKFLNLGYPLAAGAGTDAMTNYASLRGPVGLNRAYLKARADKPASLKNAIVNGNGFVTNGPLVGILAKVKGSTNYLGPGERLALPETGGMVSLKLALDSYVPVQQLEVVQNGLVIRHIDLSKNNFQARAELDIPVTVSGWILLRAANDNANIFVQDIYTYATTNPIWIDVSNNPQLASEDASYFLTWLERIKTDVNSRSEDFNADWERSATLVALEQAKQNLLEKLHAED